MKKILAVVLVVAMVATCLYGCGAKEELISETQTEASKESAPVEEVVESTEDKLIGEIVDYFMPLTEIPRQSHHEEKVSEYLYNWANERGFNPKKDAQNNVIFDVPATEGNENAPMTILQGHMDMVIAVADGKDFDPQKDGIKVINDGVTLKADGTSLGADDGMGIATILHLVEKNTSHGPLRIICTTNEEDGMTGAFALTKDDVSGAKYVINIDSENTKEVTNSAAAGVIVNFTLDPEKAAPIKKEAMEISITGLKSGHSGLDIDKGHLNGIIVMGTLLNVLAYRSDVDFELASLVGGSANNAIPAKAVAKIVIDKSDEEKVNEAIASFTEIVEAIYGGIEVDFKLSNKACDMPSEVFTNETKENILNFVWNIHDGVNTMSKEVDGLVESSSNLGLMNFDATNKEASTASSYVRSSSNDRLEELVSGQIGLAKECGIEATSKVTSDPWPVKTDSKLIEMVKKAYLNQTGTEIKVVQLHAGLETGTFAKLDPSLDIVSVGLDIKDPHTINETCYLNTLPTTYRMVEEVLADIAKESK